MVIRLELSVRTFFFNKNSSEKWKLTKDDFKELNLKEKGKQLKLGLKW